MIQLTKNMIRNLASSEKTYMRGMQYFQNGRIQNASYSKSGKRYKIIVKGILTIFNNCVFIKLFVIKKAFKNSAN